MTRTVMVVGLIAALVLSLGGAALSVAPAWAEVKASENTVAFAGEPVTTPAERLRGGVRDLTTGWTAFFHTVAAETVEHGPATGLLVGTLEGTNQALQQTLRGAYETTTFFLPVPRPQPTASEPGTLLEVRF
jgi:putative exosortase-associated protein (TIGR04073 family)